MQRCKKSSNIIFIIYFQLGLVGQWKMNLDEIYKKYSRERGEFEDLLKKQKITLKKFHSAVMDKHIKEWTFSKKNHAIKNLKVLQVTPICKECFDDLALQMINKYLNLKPEKKEEQSLERKIDGERKYNKLKQMKFL